MRREWKLGLVPLALLPITVGSFLIGGRHSGNGSSLFDEVMARVSQDAVEAPSEDELYQRAARGLVERLGDPYADLYSPEQLAEFQRQSLGNAYGGIGMQIEDQQGNVTVTKIFPNTPAETGGVRPGDRIVGVGGHDVSGWKLKEVSDSLIGKPGTQVAVVFSRSGVMEPIRTTFTRAIVHVPAVPFAMVLQDGIGYVPLQRFNDTSAEELAKAISDLKTKGAHAFILDLRGDPGGSLDQALRIGDLLLPRGEEIASVRYRNQPTDTYDSERDPLLPEAPLVVLADAYTASASEIVTGALQDHDRALVIGTPTFGKGLVQTVFRLQQGWALKLTTGKWYTPSGRSIQKEGHGLHTDDPDAQPDAASCRDFAGTCVDDEPDSATGPKPEFHSDNGRIIYGGGGITPDVRVEADTMNVQEQALMKALAPHSQDAYVALYDLALQLKDSVGPDFHVTPAMRGAYFDRLTAKGVDVDRTVFDAAGALVDRMIEQRVSTIAFGDSAAFRRNAPYDAQLKKAIDYLQQGRTQKQLFALAAKQGE